ncbi:T9SS type A sorting domain-containing protein [Danxiaibacter flavus]|uniref:T9SS type A sorting domain-containing protein n=1 Tax=Danxiaibacter flavus TaxID=3049108 RepID=A0ABV3ZA58_9BACT|nr:T9SS type A sorting domain-containing protein [Chitinophagaceae bacterium DXS]
MKRRLQIPYRFCQHTIKVGRAAESAFRSVLGIIIFPFLLLFFQLQSSAQTVVNFDANSVVTIAGDSASGFANGTGLAARFNLPANMIFDKISGNIFICDRNNNRIRKMTTDGVVTTYAGTGVAGYLDGAAASARFSSPTGITVDNSGNVYVADGGTRIRKITPGGTVSTLAGAAASGYVNATGAAARFDGLVGITINAAGNIFAVDRYNYRIRKITPAGAVSTFAGDGGTDSYDGKGTHSGFGSAHDIMADKTGNLYVLEYYGPMRKITPDTTVTSIVLTSLETTSEGGSDIFGFPIGITIDSLNNIHLTVDVASSSGDNIIRKITPLRVASRLAGSGGTDPTFADGVGPAAHFFNLNGITADKNGNYYIADQHRIRKLSVVKLNPFITSTGLASARQSFRVSGNNLTANISVTPPAGYEVSLSPGGGYVNSLSLAPMSGERPSVTIYIRLKSSSGAGLHNGNISLSSTGATTKMLPVAGFTFGPVLRFDPIAVTTLAGSTIGFADGTGAAAQFSGPRGIGINTTGTILVADQGNNRIRKVTTAGVVTTFAGSGTPGLVNATGTAAQFNQPMGVATDAANNTYVADNANNVVRKITPAAVVTTFAGSSKGFANGVGSVAKFNALQGVGTDTSGNIYVADGLNNRIRKITQAAAVSTFAGSSVAGLVNDTGGNAQFRRPVGAVVDPGGNIYVADIDNHVIRKISPTGVVTTLAGSTKGFADGTGASAQFNQPNGVAIDVSGNVFVADAGNNRIRKISPLGVVTTLAGTTAGFKDSIGTLSKFNQPKGLVVDATGNIYVADANNNRIRKMSVPVLKTFTTTSGTASAAQSFSVSGLYLTSNATVTAPAGYEISLTSGGGYGPSLAFAPTGKEVASKIIYVRLKASDAAGTYNSNITLSSPGASTKNLAVKGTVNAAALAIGNYLNNDQKISVFPNPNKGAFSIRLNNVNTADARIRVTDANGRMVMDKILKGFSKMQTIPVNVSGASSGIYFIQVICKDGVFEEKVMIE